MLKITKDTHPIEVKTLTLVIYGSPGVGKTSMAFTAEKPLLLDFDRGAHRAKNRGDAVIVTRWEDVATIGTADLAGYKTLVVDTAGRALDVLTQDIIATNPKMGRGGALSLQGFGELKARFVAWCKMVRSFDLDLVLVAHADEQRRGEDVIERLDVQGGSKNEIYKSADVMGRVSIAGQSRVLNLSPTDTAFGKNPAGMPPLDIPGYDAAPDFLAGIIAQTKAALNTSVAAQAKTSEAMIQWKKRVDNLSTADDMNAAVAAAKTVAEDMRVNVKRLIMKIAKERGFTFDKHAGVFVKDRIPGEDDLSGGTP